MTVKVLGHRVERPITCAAIECSASNASKSRSRRLQRQGRVVDVEQKRRHTIETERALEKEATLLDAVDELDTEVPDTIAPASSASPPAAESKQLAERPMVHEAEVDMRGLSPENFAILQQEKTEIRRKADILLAIMQSGTNFEETLATHRAEIDDTMLRLLARRIDTAKQLEQQPATIEGLSLLYQRLKAEYDRQRASPSMRLLDEVLTLLEPEGGDQPPLPAALEAGKHAAVARLRAAFGEEGVPVADILGMAAQLATRGERAADVLVGEAVEADAFITDVAAVLEQAMEQQRQLEAVAEKLREGDPQAAQLEGIITSRRATIGLVQEVSGLARALKAEAVNKVARQ